MDPNQQFFNPSVPMMPTNLAVGNPMFMNQPGGMNSMSAQRKNQSAGLSRIPSLHLPAIIVLGIAWLLHTIATFIPYWSTYSGVSGSRAGLWSARNFDYYTIQNFYFPQPTDFPTVTNSIRFTSANTKAYIITVQFLMTFNFVLMLIVLILLVVDYAAAQRTPGKPASLLIRDSNTSDTALKYGLLLYILYVLVIFEFAAWITYVGSRHDNNWNMHVSFAFAVIVSVFLVVVFIMYVVEFLKRFQKNRTRWDYWYGQYIEWGLFVYLSALLLLLIVICCPEWAYEKSDFYSIFAEIGLFKQCYLSAIYKKAATTGYCTLSDTRSNQSWVNATQAFMLMAYIIGMIILIVIVIFRKEFRHNAGGYYAQRVSQPMFTYIIAGLILFFCFLFSLIGIIIFGAEVFPKSLTVNWAYILAIIAMILFLITGILFIMDAVHSRQQIQQKGSAKGGSFFFPAPLNDRVLAMQPLLKPQRAWPQIPPAVSPMEFTQPWPAPLLSPLPMYLPGNIADTPFFPPQQIMIMPQTMYGAYPYQNDPLAQATLANYFQQMLNNPQLPSYNQGLMNYSADNSQLFPDNRNNTANDSYFTNMVRRHFLQQQRLNYNHERLLEKYSRLRGPRVSQFRTFGASSLPGRNYDSYLSRMRGDDGQEQSLAEISRAGIGSSDETYRWMGEESSEPLPRDVSSVVQHSRNDPMPFVYAENFEPVKMYDHPIFGPTPAYIRPVFKNKLKYKKKYHNDSDNDADHGKKTKVTTTATTQDDHDDNNYEEEESRHTSMGYVSHQNWKSKHERLVPVDPLLFNIYTQRSNGSIESYGQSLYLPPSRPLNRDKQSNYYEGLFAVPPSDTDSILAEVPSVTPSSSKHRYNKLHSQPTSSRISHRPLESVSAQKNHQTSDNESDRPSRITPPPLRPNSNLTIMPSTSSSIPLISSASPVIPTVTPARGVLSTQNTSIANHSEVLSPSSLSNVPDTLNSSSISPTSPAASVSSSSVPYQTLSSIVDNPSTNALRSTSTTTTTSSSLLPHQRKDVSVDDDDLIPSSSDSDDDGDEKKRNVGGTKKNNQNFH